MGNICALDMGIMIMRVSIFDKQNNLFPHKIQKKLNYRALEKITGEKDKFLKQFNDGKD